jgi:hypothetical protein
VCSGQQRHTPCMMCRLRDARRPSRSRDRCLTRRAVRRPPRYEAPASHHEHPAAAAPRLLSCDRGGHAGARPASPH